MEVVGDLSHLTAIDAFYCALAAAITMTALTIFAIPASCSQAIIGAVLGAGILSSTADFSKLLQNCGVLGLHAYLCLVHRVPSPPHPGILSLTKPSRASQSGAFSIQQGS